MNNVRSNRGRPRGTTKDPNRLKIRNHNNRWIDVNGPQYQKLIRNGYIPNRNNTRLILNGYIPNENNNRACVDSTRKVKNPLTDRQIIVNGSTFKNVVKQGYTYNESNNSLLMYIVHPKNENKQIVKDSDKFNSFLERGYIYDQKSNSFKVPSVKTDTAFQNGKVEYDLVIQNNSDATVQTSSLNNRIRTLCMRKLLNTKQSIKINIGMDIIFTKPNSDGNIVINKISLKSKACTINNKNEINKGIRSANEQLFSRIDRFTNNGSGWVIDEIRRHYLHIIEHSPLVARSYVKLPSWIQNKKATINIKNTDNKCFIYCLARALDPNPQKRDLERVSSHLVRVCEQLNLNNIKVPVSIKDIPKIEKDHSISINIYGHTKGSFTVIRTTREKFDKHVDLLYTSDDETEHYVWIKNFNRLMARINKNDHAKFFCRHCLQHFSKKEILDRHVPNCVTLNGSQAAVMPKENSKIAFKNLKNTIACPFIIYADLEAILEPIEQQSKLDNQSPYTIKTQKHIPCAFGYKVVCQDNDKYSLPYKSYTGENTITKFFENLLEDEKYIIDCMKIFKKSDIIMTKQQLKDYHEAKKCYICGGEFTSDNKKLETTIMFLDYTEVPLMINVI